MRLVFQCTECGINYLPPEGLTYGDGSPASPLWCTEHLSVMRERGVSEPPSAVAIALLAARQRAADPAVEQGAPRPDVRPSRPTRTRRGAKSPGGGRSKLR
ncbi:hypothetical protein [Kitasatospora sp. GAS204B]|uniref:hypothetical protein n=1 Tax=unclassified Kitasatospora TaxID=2633591 RepID=UPI002473E469|nr:hypothetical protein [Kitasatospora sp. GAS204B]MDH6122938.1 hypothetical protein [Kitasatospora sp. GAS204B]